MHQGLSSSNEPEAIDSSDLLSMFNLPAEALTNDPFDKMPAESGQDVLTSGGWQTCNHLQGITTLNNRYFALRHGRSEANVAGIHSGDAQIAATKYGLVEEGVQQVESSISEAIATGVLDGNVIVYCSEFLRARQSAEVALKLLGIQDLGVEPALGERGAGELESKTSTGEERKELLELFHSEDARDPFNHTLGFESPAAVLARTTDLIRNLELRHTGQTILLVSHHDAIQILRRGFQKKNPGEFWQIGSLSNAALVELTLANAD